MGKKEFKKIKGELFNRPVPKRDLREVDSPGRPDYTPKVGVAERVRRFILGKNKAGKAFYVAVTAAGIFTGFNLTPVIDLLTNQGGPSTMDISWTEIILMAITGILGFIASRELVKGLLQEILAEVSDIVLTVQAARSDTGPGGRKITDEEKKLILKEVDDLVLVLYKRLLRSRIAKIFGLKKKKPEQ